MFAPRSYLFLGATPEFAVIVAGIHPSEQSGVEVAEWIQVKLAARPKPTKRGVLVIPEVFPGIGLGARAAEWRSGPQQTWREIKEKGVEVFQARHFPPPGQAESALTKSTLLDRGGAVNTRLTSSGKPVTQRPEIAYVVRCIEILRPTVIVSCHGRWETDPADVATARKNGRLGKEYTDMTDEEFAKWLTEEWHGEAIKGMDFPGVFVDPRYTPGNACKGFDLEACKFDPIKDPAFPTQGTDADLRFDSAVDPDGRKDDAMALAMAQAVSDPTLVTGNHLGSVVEVVHYAKAHGTPMGFSLGDWGPVVVTSGKDGVGNRPSAPVFTIEVKDNNQSWAFLDGVQIMSAEGKPLNEQPPPGSRAVNQAPKPYKQPPGYLTKFSQKRSKELQAYAQAIIDVGLDG